MQHNACMLIINKLYISSELNIDAVQKTSKDLSPDKSLSCDKVSNVSDIPETLMREWIINHEKYKHLFKGIGHFKCNPISIECKKDPHQSENLLEKFL